ncbi:GntR family transcriptional regulator [Enterovirga sp. CN4-39]|uniref:GntR family transcriptional regulator n=1 Tax=Enterovirga sp. CN4-39 TaxID=3400910 RepID=UPI003C0954AB
MPETLAAKAYDAIEHLIVEGSIPPGDLLSEVSLSQQIGIGRTPVREALQRLERDQLIVVEPRRGVRVTDIDRKRFEQAMEVREALEPVMSRLAALSACRGQRLELRALAQAMMEAADGGSSSGLLDVDFRFKRVVAEACGNPLLTTAIRPLHSVSRHFFFRHARTSQRSVALAHAALMDLIASGDAAGAEAASQRFLHSIRRFAKSVRARRDAAPDQGSAQHRPDADMTLAGQAFRAIESLVVSQTYPPGEVLSELRLSAELGIGRTPVREALQRLSAFHLVTIQARRGAVVAELDRYDASTLNEARLPLEQLLSRLAARRCTDRQRAELKRLGVEWVRAAERGPTAEIIAIDARMKSLVIAAAANPFLERAIAPLHAMARRSYFGRATIPDADVAAAQAELLDRIAAGDENAAALASVRFVAEAIRVVRGAMREPQPA